jgi:hypothetical protein
LSVILLTSIAVRGTSLTPALSPEHVNDTDVSLNARTVIWVPSAA